MWVGGPHSSITHILLTLYPFYQRQGGDLFSPPRLGFCLLLLAILTIFPEACEADVAGSLHARDHYVSPVHCFSRPFLSSLSLDLYSQRLSAFTSAGLRLKLLIPALSAGIRLVSFVIPLSSTSACQCFRHVTC